MASIFLIGALAALFLIYILRRFVKFPRRNQTSGDNSKLERWKKILLLVWRIGVMGYAFWLILNFWKVIVFPVTPITLDQISNIIFHPPFIQVILIITFAWFIIALVHLPSMQLKGINTPFLRFEMDKVKEVVLQGNADLEASRVSDEIRWIAVNLATIVNPYDDLDIEEGVTSDIELFAIAMGGIILDAFRTVYDEIDFASGIITVDTGGLNDDILYFPPEAQYVMRNAYKDNTFYYKGMSLAVPIRFKETDAIFYLYNSSVQIYKMDCTMVETIWDILLKNVVMKS